MTLIYQVGRLRGERQRFKLELPEARRPIELETELSGIALKRALNELGKEAKLILIYPVSLVVQLNCGQRSSEKLKHPAECIEKIPMERERDFGLIVHSPGSYRDGEGGTVELKGQYGDIVLEIFFDMVKRFLETNVEEVYLDISSGHNIYPSAMLEASRYFTTFTGLFNLADEKFPQLHTVFSDPIIGREYDKPYSVHTQKQFFTVNFFSPLISLYKRSASKDLDFQSWLNQRFKDQILTVLESKKYFKEEIFEKLKSSLLLYSAVVNSLPLYLYYLKKHPVGEIKDAVLRSIQLAEAKLYSDYENSPGLDKELYVEILCQLALYAGMVNLLEKLNVHMDEDRGVELRTLVETFKHVQQKTNLRSIFFENEIDYLANLLAQRVERGEVANGWSSLAEIIGSTNQRDFLHKRNFFAHIGLEKNITQVRMDPKILEKTKGLTKNKIKKLIKLEKDLVFLKYYDTTSLKENWFIEDL